MEDRLKQKLALEYIRPLLDGKQPTAFAKLGEQHKLNQRVVSSAVYQAFQSGLISVSRKALAPALDSTGMKGRLEDAFNIPISIVVELDDGEFDNDHLHKNLGSALANELVENRRIRNDDLIGLGSGRGVYYSVMGMYHRSPVQAENVRVMSLTGSLFPTNHKRELNVVLDADLNTGLLSVLAFEPPAVNLHIARPIAHRNAPAILKETRLLSDEKIGLACIGVGVLHDNHRLYRAIKDHQSGINNPDDKVLRPIREELTEIVRIVDQLNSRVTGYLPVADICNRLFLVPPPKDIRNLVVSDIAQLEKLVEIVNERLVTVTFERLAKVSRLMVVAGGDDKVGALRCLLNPESPPYVNVGVLCTDTRTAKALLAND